MFDVCVCICLLVHFVHCSQIPHNESIVDDILFEKMCGRQGMTTRGMRMDGGEIRHIWTNTLLLWHTTLENVITCDFFPLPLSLPCLGSSFFCKPPLIFQTMNHIVSGTQYFYMNMSLFLSLASQSKRIRLCIIYVSLTCAYCLPRIHRASKTSWAIQHIVTIVVIGRCCCCCYTYLCAKTRKEAFNLNSFIIVNSAT